MKIGDKVVMNKEGASHSWFIRGEVVEITSIGHIVWEMRDSTPPTER